MQRHPEASGVQDAASLAYAVLGAASGGGGGGDGGDAAAQRQMAMMQRKRAILRLFARTEMRAALQMQRAFRARRAAVRGDTGADLDAGDLAPETCRRRRHRQRCRRRRDRRRRDRRRRARRRRTRRRRRQNCEDPRGGPARAARASAEAAERRARQLQAAAAMKASDPEVRAALAMQTLWRALCARRALTLARRRAASDQMAWQRQLIASVERERQEEEAARFVQDAYRAAVRRKRLNLVRKRAAEHAEQKRKQELAERQQAFRDAREKRKREAATSFDPAAAEKVTAEREARAKRDRLVAAEPARVKGRGVGAVVGAVLGERRARIAGGVLQIDGLPPSGAQQVALNGTLNPTPLDARAGEFPITVGGAVVVLKAAGAEAMQAWIDAERGGAAAGSGAGGGGGAGGWRPNLPRQPRGCGGTTL